MQPDLQDEPPSPIPPDLRTLLAEAGCCEHASPAAQRAALEALAAINPTRVQVLDGHLVGLRERELLDGEFPAVIGGIRRTAMLADDALTVSWLGWHEGTGERVALRCLKPRWRRDPVASRRVELGLRVTAALPGLAPASFEPRAPWPHVAYRLPGMPLADLLPAEDPPETIPLVRWLASALQTLATLHERGLRFGPLGSTRVLLAEHRAFLLWLDPVGLPPGGAPDDLAALAASLARLDPWGQHPLSQILLPWAGCPPSSAPEAARIVRRGLADELASARHRLALLRRNRGHARDAALLHRAALALDRCLPPPTARSCLHAGPDRTLHLVESDGRCVRGGPSAQVPPAALPTLYQPGKGLDLAATRVVLRAWARRAGGDESLRAQAQGSWEGSDEDGASLVRWLAAAARLRRAQLMLAQRLRRA